MKSSLLMLASLVHLWWGESTRESISSANPPNSDFKFADFATTSTQQDPCPTDDGKLEPGQTSPKKSIEDQIDDLLAIWRDIQSFIMSASPGAGCIVIIIPIFSLLQKRIGAACIIAGGFAAQICYRLDVGSPIHLF
ncbi:hypothetical protein FPCIR_1417 [Fusarium pseudocircinatum]|uniref:Uncharacterized protein n=1 Tax=Fusarium pseudocircinatum TaxID=56676 RepID=A0A8H5PU26_9HYPO|nr:hypothetical protein FPCIR_1417 [Fusarium pseudocircinatum]